MVIESIFIVFVVDTHPHFPSSGRRLVEGVPVFRLVMSRSACALVFSVVFRIALYAIFRVRGSLKALVDIQRRGEAPRDHDRPARASDLKLSVAVYL